MGVYIDICESDIKLEYVVADASARKDFMKEKREESMDYQYIREDVIAEVIEKDPLIRGISFGVPGVVDGGIVESCDVESLTGVDIKGNIKRRFGIEAEVRNDMDFISYGIYSGASVEGDLATIFFPTDENGCVGAGFIIGGKVINGSSQYSGELSYIAEAFGISRKHQEEMRRDRGEFCDLVFKMVMIVIGTVDPEKIVIMGNDINSEELMRVWSKCNEVISKKHIPDISIDSNIERNYAKGLVSIALNKLQFPISMDLQEEK